MKGDVAIERHGIECRGNAIVETDHAGRFVAWSYEKISNDPFSKERITGLFIGRISDNFNWVSAGL